MMKKMIRRRPSTESNGLFAEQSELPGLGRRHSRRGGLLASSSSEKNGGRGAENGLKPQHDDHIRQKVVKPILPCWMILVLCCGFIGIGFVQNHYEESRKRDPLRERSLIRYGGGPSLRTNWAMTKSLLTPKEDAALEIDPNTGSRYHIIFSTDCSDYQAWQSYLVFYSALTVGQPGHVTRIASGCNATEAVVIQEWFTHYIQPQSPHRFHLHLTPHFSSVKDKNGQQKDYKFFNKPFGLLHWMEHSPQLKFDATKRRQKFSDKVLNDVVILIDPDMAILRPITADFSNLQENLLSEKRRTRLQELGMTDMKVGVGRPFAQGYGFGAQWGPAAKSINVASIAGADSPAVKVDIADGRLLYPAGPPYLVAVKDMYPIAQKWTEFVPKVYEQHSHLLAEMFAFSMAAAHLELPFTLMDSLMVSDVEANGEGWPLIDTAAAENVCLTAQYKSRPLPNVLHYCQRYMMGTDWFFSKRKLPMDMYDCQTPLFAEPPSDLAAAYDYRHAPGGHKIQVSTTEAKRHAFALCSVYGLLNKAATFYKQQACPADQMNLEKTRSLVEYLAEQKK